MVQVEGNSNPKLVSLRSFLTSRDISIRTNYYAQVYDRFTGLDVIFPVSGRGARRRYLVDSEKLEMFADRLRELSLLEKQENLPFRTPEEVESYRSQILRVFPTGRQKKDRLTYRPITLEEAVDILQTEAVRHFQTGPLNESADELAKLVINKCRPYLEGKVGEFLSLGNFRRRFFMLTVRSVFRDRMNKGL